MKRLPPLMPLHPDSSLSRTKLADFEKLSTEAIMATLLPGHDHCLKTRADGTMLDGHHRIWVLRQRNIAVDQLPREIQAAEALD